MESGGLQYLQALLQCRELSSAITRLASQQSLYTIDRTLKLGVADLQVSLDSDAEVSSELAQVAELCLKDFETPELSLPLCPTAVGTAVLRSLQAAVFGEDSLQQSFMRCVYLASLPQAVLAQQLCVATLLDLVSTQNCMSLHCVAAACGCGILQQHTHKYALAHFSEAAQQDYSGLVSLEEEQLLSFLCSDALQVESEMDVFRALVAWVEHDRTQRMPKFAARLARALRLTQLDTSDLAYMDVHPVVASDRMALSLVAHTYICKLMGLELSQPFGMRSGSRPRHCQRSSGPPTPCSAAAGLLACGNARHAGQHQSVFEAVVCGFARRRWAGLAQEQAEVEVLAQEAAAPEQCPATASSSQVQDTLPLSPALLGSLPTPTNSGLQPAAPKLQPVSRVHVFGSAKAKRSGSRRSLFTMAAEAEEQETAQARLAHSSSAHLSHAAAGVSGSKELEQSGQPASPAAHMTAARAIGGVQLEMFLSPSRAGLRAMAAQHAQQAQASALEHQWQSKKRLRFL